MKAIDVEEFAQTCLDIEKDQEEQGNYANALFISEIRKMISTYPTVEAAPVKHGRWEPVKNLEGMFKCSLCGDEWGSAAKMVPMQYCPACGAKMDLEEQCENN